MIFCRIWDGQVLKSWRQGFIGFYLKETLEPQNKFEGKTFPLIRRVDYVLSLNVGCWGT